MNKPIPRETAMTPEAMIASIMIQLASFQATELLAEAHIITATAGLGESWAITEPLALWEEGWADYFLVAGMATHERDFHELTVERLTQDPYNLKRTDDVLTQPVAANTPDQTNWIVSQVGELYQLFNGFERLIVLFTCRPYHLPRAYLTLLKSFLKSEHKDKDILFVPMTLPVPLTRKVPNAGKTALELVPGEIERILAYQEKGDVATLEELNAYIARHEQYIYG